VAPAWVVPKPKYTSIKKCPQGHFFLPSRQNRTNLFIAIYLPLAGAECLVFQEWEVGGGVEKVKSEK